MKQKRKTIKAGDVFPISSGGSIQVLEYINAHKVVIKHLCPYEHVATSSTQKILSGNVRNPYAPSVYGIGFIGVGEPSKDSLGRHTAAYAAWREMFKRCYCKKYQAGKPSYIGCTIAPEWYNFQVFHEWFSQQKNAGKSGFELDKDLRVLGNKRYGPDTCSFVPRRINSLLSNRGGERIDLPAGVHMSGRKFYSCINEEGKNIYLGSFASIALASDAYRTRKEAYVHRMACKYKNNLHEDVFETLNSWTFLAE